MDGQNLRLKLDNDEEENQLLPENTGTQEEEKKHTNRSIKLQREMKLVSGERDERGK